MNRVFRLAARCLIVLSLGTLIGLSIFAVRHWPAADVRDPPLTADDGSPVMRRSIAAPVDDFIRFARTPRGTVGRTGPHHVAAGLRALAGALDSLQIGRDGLTRDLRVGASTVLRRPDSLESARLMRALSIRTARALSPGWTLNETVTPHAEAIGMDRSLAQQQSTIENFFEAASHVLDRRRGRGAD